VAGRIGWGRPPWSRSLRPRPGPWPAGGGEVSALGERQQRQRLEAAHNGLFANRKRLGLRRSAAALAEIVCGRWGRAGGGGQSGSEGGWLPAPRSRRACLPAGRSGHRGLEALIWWKAGR